MCLEFLIKISHKEIMVISYANIYFIFCITISKFSFRGKSVKKYLGNSAYFLTISVSTSQVKLRSFLLARVCIGMGTVVYR